MASPVNNGSSLSGSTIDLNSTASQSVQPSTEDTAESVELAVQHDYDPFLVGAASVFEAVCLFDTHSSLPPAHEVSTTYVNGSYQTLLEAQTEGLYLSEIRGEPVRLIYHPGQRGSRFCGRPVYDVQDPLCQTILDCLHYFFSHAQNQGRRHTIIFFGDAGGLVQAVLDNSPYASQVDVVGIAPTIYIRGHHATHFRVRGDLSTLLDREGFVSSDVTTLPYSSGAEGVFFPGLRCPTYRYALCFTGGRASEPSQEETAPCSGHSIAMVTMGDGNAFTRLNQMLAAGDTSAESEYNYYPTSVHESLMAGVFSLFRVSGLLQEYLVIPTGSYPNLYVSYCIISGYTVDLFGHFLLFFTNRRSLRDRFRGVRLLARARTPFVFLITATDCLNCLRRVGSSPAILPPLFVTAATLSGAVVFMDVMGSCLVRLRGRIQNLALAGLGGRQEHHAVVRREDASRAGAVQSLISGMHLAFMCLGIGVLSQICIQVASSIGRSDSEDTGVFSRHLHNTSYVWRSGDIYGMSQAVHFFLTMIILVINIVTMVRLVRRYRR